LEPEPLEYKTGAGAAPPKNTGAGAAKIMRLLYQLLEDKKYKEIS